MGFPAGSAVENPPANAADLGSVPGLKRSPGEGNGHHSSTLAREIRGQRSLEGCSLGSQSRTRLSEHEDEPALATDLLMSP